MKRKRQCIYYCKYVFMLVASVFGVTAYQTQVEAVSIHKTSETIVVGYDPEYGMVMEAYDGTQSGFAPDYFEMISDYTGDEYEFVQCEFADAFDLLEQGKIDIWGPVSYTGERANQFLYTDAPLGEEHIYLASLRADAIEFDDYDAIETRVIGVIEDSANITYLDKYCHRNQIAPKIINIPELALNDRTQQSLILVNSFQMQPQYEVVADLGYDKVYYVTRKDDNDLMSSLNQAMEEVRIKHPNAFGDLYAKYYPDVAYAKQHVTEAEQQLIQAKGIYRVGYYINHIPFSYNDINNDPAGIAISVMNEIAEEAGIQVEYVPMNKEQSEPQDIDINLSILQSLRLSYHDMQCEPYMELPLMLIGYYDELSYQEATIGYLDYIGLDVRELETFLPGAKFVLFDSMEDMIANLTEGKIGYAISTNLVSKQILEAVPDAKGIARTFGEDSKASFSLAEDISEELGPIFNKYIDRIDEADLYTRIISTSYQATLNQEVPKLLVEHYREIFLILFLIIGFGTTIVSVREVKSNRRLKKDRDEDSVTDLLTEVKFIEECMKRIDETYGEYTLVSVDIDNFKDINEVCGYEAGTRVLKEFATVLKDSYGNDDLIARVHGDIFLILTTTKDPNSAYCGKASCEFCALPKIASILGENYSLNVSVGAYHIVDSTIDITHIIDCANIARHKSKKHYGCVSTTYSESMDMKAHMQSDILRSMEAALENREFRVVYQPKIDFVTGQVCGAEALVRWVREDLSMVYPDEFIPLFEKNGFIVNLDYYMLSRVCEFISLNDPINMPKVSVNLSGITVLQRDLIDRISDIVNGYGVSPESLELEITESAFIENIQIITEKIEELITLGFSISMDDFGTGISSLNRLKDINVHVLKIDREFLNNTLEDKKRMLIIGDIVRMARQLGIQSIAEGVETRAQLELLGHLGCDMGQGYYFAKPLAEHEYRGFLQLYDGTDNVVKEKVSLDTEEAQKIGENSVSSLIMASTENIVYISDVATYELYFLSKQGERNAGNITEDDWKGKKCYEILHGRTSPCEFCTNHLLNEETFYKWERYEADSDTYYAVQNKLIELEDKLVRLEVAIDITERATLEHDIEEKLHEEEVLIECVELLHRFDLSDGEAINELLRILGKYYEAERGYIFAISEDSMYIKNTFEWCDQGIEPQIEFLQEVDIELVNHWFKKYDEIGEFYIDSLNDEIDKNSEEYRILDSQGIVSLVTAPLRNEAGDYIGFIGVDNPKNNIKNTTLIRSVTTFVDEFFYRNELLKKLQRVSSKDELT